MGKKDNYETFDSLGGPIQKSIDDSGSRDSMDGLKSDGDRVEQGEVPEMPQVKR